jgi:drug/metabolite transporter (DMT)-like permease
LAPVIAFLGSIIFFGEILTINKILGTSFIIIATIIVAYKNSKLKTGRGFWLAVFVAVIYGLAWMIDKPGSNNIPAGFYSLIIWLLPLPIIAFPKIKIIDLKKEIKNAGMWVIILGLINALGFYTLLKALSLAEASRVIPIISSASVLTIIGGIFILNEKSHIWRKLLAGVIMFAGILLLK